MIPVSLPARTVDLSGRLKPLSILLWDSGWLWGEYHLVLQFLNVIMLLIAGYSITHLVLFFLRCALAFRMRFWRGFQRWRLPAGQLTIEFTVKFLRQEPQTVDGEQSQ